jgi:hypothetical protein
MTRTFRSLLMHILMAAVVSTGLIGCGGGGGGPSIPPPVTGKYVVTGKVKDFHTNAAVVGATVTIGSKTVTTDSTGYRPWSRFMDSQRDQCKT